MKFYRYQENITHTGGMSEWGEWISSGWVRVEVKLLTFKSIKETPKGHWISMIFTDFDGNESVSSFKKQWVSKTSRKRFAYPTKEEALNSFLIRKKKQIQFIKKTLTNVEKALKIGEQIKL